MTDRTAEQNELKQDFGEALSLYSQYSAESLLRKYFAADSGERLRHLQDQMIARAVCGDFEYVLDLGSLFIAQSSDSTLHPVTRKTIDDPERFRHLAKYLCEDLLGARSGSLSATLIDSSDGSGAEKNGIFVKFQWRPTPDREQFDGKLQPPLSPHNRERQTPLLLPPNQSWQASSWHQHAKSGQHAQNALQAKTDLPAPVLGQSTSSLDSKNVRQADAHFGVKKEMRDDFIDISSSQASQPIASTSLVTGRWAPPKRSVAYF